MKPREILHKFRADTNKAFGITENQAISELRKWVEGKKCQGEYGCPRCGTKGVCGSVVNQALEDLVKDME